MAEKQTKRERENNYEKKILLVFLTILLMVIFLTGCDSSATRNGQDNFMVVDNEYIQLETLSNNDGCVIAYDKETKVMYMCVSGYSEMGITPIYNADGSLKLYQEEQ